MSGNCPARADTANTVWAFCPSTPAAILFAVLFGLTTSAHLSQAIFYKKRYCWVIICSGLIQTANYISRIISIKNPNSLPPYEAWFVLILIAPLFTNAFVYMVMGRMVWNYIPNAKLYRVTAWRFTTYFVLLDIIALLVQIAGAASGANSKSFDQTVLNGIHIYMGGVAFQQLSIFAFSFFAIKFHRTILRQIREGVEEVSSALPMLYAMYAVLLLITMRIGFRLAEYAHGYKSTIPNHEAYQYCLDSAPMICSLVILNFVHPGRIMPGVDSDIPGRKERKAKGIREKSQKVNESSPADGLTV